MNRPDCACVHPDPCACAAMRDQDKSKVHRCEDKCECSCHHENEDGYTEWDDYEEMIDEDLIVCEKCLPSVEGIS